MSQDRAKARGRPRTSTGGSSQTAGPSVAAGSRAGPSYANGPAVGLGGGVQSKAKVGQSGDAYEREADAIASKVASGGTLGSAASQTLGPGGVGRETAATQKPEEKKPEAGVQKADDTTQKPDEKKPEESVQKADATEKPEEKKPEASVQKADVPEQKVEDKQPEGPVQKADAAPSSTQKPEEKKPEASVQKAEATPATTQKPEEKKPEANVQKADETDTEQPTDETQTTPEEDASVQRADEQQQAAAGGGAGASMPEQSSAPASTPQEAQSQKPPQQSQAQPGASMDEIAQQAISSAGPGRAMNPQTRQTLEQRMGADLTNVRIHDDPAAQKATQQLNARAFTHGQDIWLAAGQTDADVELMAHEVTHVLQQGSGTEIQRSTVRRAPAATAPAPAETAPGEAAVDADEESDSLVQRAPAIGAAALPSVPPTGTGSVPNVQRLGPPPGPGGGGGTSKGSFDHTNKVLEVPSITVPGFKKSELPATITIEKNKGLGKKAGGENAKWRSEIGAKITPDTASQQLTTKHPGLTGVLTSAETDKTTGKPGLDARTYFFEIAGGRYLVINKHTIANAFVIPTWTKKAGGPRQRKYDVDQLLDEQFGSDPKNIKNLWLVDAALNRGAGPRNRKAINDSMSKAITDAFAPNQTGSPWPKNKPSITQVRKRYDVKFNSVVAGDPQKADTWKYDEVEQFNPIDELKPISAADAVTRKLVGDKAELALYLTPGGTKARRFPLDGKGFADPNRATSAERLRGIDLDPIAYKPGTPGVITGTAFREKAADPNTIMPKPFGKGSVPAWKLIELADYTVMVDQSTLKESLKYAELQGMSPIQFDEVNIDDAKGVQARGKLTASLPLIKGTEIFIVAEGGDVGLSATFTADDIKLPGPIKVTDASVSLSLFTRKIAVDGEVSLEIPNAAKGTVTAFADTTGDWGVTGKIEFDTNLFKPAEVEVSYRKGKLSGKGKLGVEKGKIKGIDSAEITASVEDGNIEATGTVKPSIPGIEQASLTVKYGEKTGILIGGDLQLKKDIPGLEGGSVKVEVSKKPGEERYRVKASGEAKPKIPGVTSMLKVEYDDGAFNANVTAGYEKGMLKGSITVGATNSPVGPDGKPVPGSPGGDQIIVYGGGSLTLKLSPWLQGTAAVMLKPNGEIEVKGEIGLPASIDLLPEKAFTKNLFKIGIDIPIVGVSVAGQRIGIFANITGGADLSAGIGPVQLNQLSLSVTYNPDHEDQTLVSGKANLHVPAHAGIRLFVRGGIGVGIPIVSAQAGLEIGAELGLVGALDAGVQLDWSPAKGIVLDAKGSLFVEPKLKVDLTGFVLVEADLLLTTITLYEQKWKLAGFEVGSGLRLGVTFPIHYEEGKPFDISLSDLEFQVPDINPGDVLDNIIKQIV